MRRKSRPMSKYPTAVRFGAFIAVLCLIASPTFGSHGSWLDNYDQGLKWMAKSDYEAAIRYLEMAVADKPLSEIVEGTDRRTEYLPYLQLGICYYNLNKIELAREYLELEGKLSALSSSQESKQLWESYRTKLASHPAKEREPSYEKIRDFTKRKYLLSDTEAERLKREIRHRCRLPEAEDKSYPWYYHYELGLAFEKKDDWQRALDSFLLALDHKGEPGKLLRIYGVWFIDYFPYYQIGRAHYNLRNWECAREAFLLSETFEDIRPSDPEHSELKKYLEDLENVNPSQ